MRNPCVAVSLVLLLFSLAGCATLNKPVPVSEERMPISKDNKIIVESLPDLVDSGEVIIVATGKKEGEVTIGSGSVVIIRNGQYCIFCAEKLKIFPNLTVLISRTESFISGPTGCTIKRTKGDKSVLLLEGEAFLLKKRF